MTASPRESLAADLVEVTDATARLTERVDGLTDPDLAAPSILPGWSRAHVVGHVARNAEGMVNLVAWALTGRVSPMYPSAEARSVGIEQAVALPSADLRRLLDSSAVALAAATGRLVAADDVALARLLVFGPAAPGTQPDVPAWTLGWARLRETEIHHLDLGAGLEPTDWPDAFVRRMGAFLDSRSARPDVVGDAAEVVAWRLGRGRGPTVRSGSGGDPGEPPAW